MRTELVPWTMPCRIEGVNIKFERPSHRPTFTKGLPFRIGRIQINAIRCEGEWIAGGSQLTNTLRCIGEPPVPLAPQSAPIQACCAIPRGEGEPKAGWPQRRWSGIHLRRVPRRSSQKVRRASLLGVPAILVLSQAAPRYPGLCRRRE